MEASDTEAVQPRIPSLPATVELKEALIEEDVCRTKLLDPRATSTEMQVAARELASAHERVKAAVAAVGYETGVLELPILRDERPRFTGGETPQ